MTSSTATNLQGNYDTNAAAYLQFVTTPLGKLEQQLFEQSITDLSGQDVLDLGGGTGLRALDALRAGARHVDVIDISPEMMRVGQEAYEKSLPSGALPAIHWHQADISKPLDYVNSLGPYDMVIANGIFDHAHNENELEQMWRNAALLLKPGGRLVANRNNPLSKAATSGKYGVTLTDFEHFEGGLSFRYRMNTDPPLAFQSFALDVYYKGSTELSGKFFENFENVQWEQTPVVKADFEFWRDYLDDPILYIFTAVRRGELE